MSPEMKTHLEELTDQTYDSVVSGGPCNGIVGLVHGDGIDVATKIVNPIFGPNGEISRFVRYSGLELEKLSSPFIHDGQSIPGASILLYALYDNCKSGKESSAPEIEFVHRNEAAKNKFDRLDTFLEIYETLTPDLKNGIRVVDFRSASATSKSSGSFAVFVLGLLRIGREDKRFRYDVYHETAHLQTEYLSWISPEFVEKWETLKIDVCEGEDLRDEDGVYCDDDYRKWEQFIEEGLVSSYAGKDYNEEISEITANVYTCPGYVSWLADKSPKLREKLNLLNEHGYIDDVRYASLYRGEENQEFERKWETLASNESYDSLEWLGMSMTEEELFVSGFIHNEGREGTIADIMTFLGAIDHDPDTVRNAMERSPIIRNKVELLYKYKLISEEQYILLTSTDPSPSFANLYHPLLDETQEQGDSFANSATYYFDTD